MPGGNIFGLFKQLFDTGEAVPDGGRRGSLGGERRQKKHAQYVWQQEQIERHIQGRLAKQRRKAERSGCTVEGDAQYCAAPIRKVIEQEGKSGKSKKNKATKVNSMNNSNQLHERPKLIEPTSMPRRETYLMAMADDSTNATRTVSASQPIPSRSPPPSYEDSMQKVSICQETERPRALSSSCPTHV